SVLTVGAELVLGVSVAALLARQFAGRGVVRLLLLLPWAVPTVVAGKMWEWLFNYDAGLLNTVLARLAGEAARVDWLGSLPAAYISLGVADVWKTTPYVIFLSLAALIGLDPDIIAAARLDGASPRRIVLNIVLPMIAPALLVIAAFRMIDAFRVFDLIYVLTGGSPGGATTSVSLLAYQKLFVTGEYAYAAAVSTISFLLFLVLAVGYLRMYRQARSFRGGAL
ncbi:MAG TPA: sugar ABC transporter permease, partial [Firmicutes bacterium]|nr:sugar ABC transporter permease [Bacillota bacterium]